MMFSARLGGVVAKKSPAALKSIKTIINISPPQAKKNGGRKSAAGEKNGVFFTRYTKFLGFPPPLFFPYLEQGGEKPRDMA